MKYPVVLVSSICHHTSLRSNPDEKQSCRRCLGVFTPASSDSPMCTLWVSTCMQNDITLTSARSCVALVCLGVFFTEVDYTYFPCCSSLWSIFHLIQIIMEPLLNVFNHWLKISLIPLCVSSCFLGGFFPFFSLGIHFEVESLVAECTLQNLASGGGQCFSDNRGRTWHKHRVTLQEI